MALLKEKKLKNGVITTYHRVKSINYNFLEEQTLVEIDSYISEEYREKEKKIYDLEKTIDILYNQYRTSIERGEKQLAESIHSRIEELNDKLEEMSSKNYIVDTSVITIDSIPEDITVSSIYKLLMTLEEYSDAKEV